MSALGRLYWKIQHCRERFGETNPAQPERPAKPRSSPTQDYHLIQVTERRPAIIMPFEDAQTEIEKTLRGGKQKQAVRAYIDTLRKRAEIQTAQ